MGRRKGHQIHFDYDICNTVIPYDGTLYTIEGADWFWPYGGLTGTNDQHLSSHAYSAVFFTSLDMSEVDTGDGWGTNLNHLDIGCPGWSQRVLTVLETGIGDSGSEMALKNKLGTMVPYDTIVGKIHHYYVERYKVNPKAIVLAGTGDNPATLMGCGGKVHEHFLRKYRPDAGTCRLTSHDWHGYRIAAGQPLLEKKEPLLLHYLPDESVPLKRKGILPDGPGREDGNNNIRALALSQALSLKLHSYHLHDMKSICIVGGGAGNHFLSQLISDVFNAKTYLIRNARYAAPLGCTISGAVAALGISYEEAIVVKGLRGHLVLYIGI